MSYESQCWPVFFQLRVLSERSCVIQIYHWTVAECKHGYPPNFGHRKADLGQDLPVGLWLGLCDASAP